MLQYKKLNSFQERAKFDKPIIKKNLDDFDDIDIDSSLSLDDSNKSDIDNLEDSFAKTKSSTTIKNKKNSNTVIKNKVSFKFNEDDKNSDISNKSKDNKKGTKSKYSNIYSDKEEEKNNDEDSSEEFAELKKSKKIENQLVMSIKNKETVTRERLHLAEEINFKNEPDKIISTDQFGFISNDDNKQQKTQVEKKRLNSVKKIFGSKSAKNLSENLLQINARMEKWSYMLEHYDEFSTKKREILKSRTRKGIPDNLRGYVWQLFAEKDKLYIPNLYKDLENQPVKEDLEKIIMKDLDRTFPLCQFFREKYGNGQRKLYKVLSAYSKYNTDVGYVQGMGFMAAIFLTYMDEESSFYMLHSLMKKYQMEDIYFNNFPGLRKKFFIFLNLQKKFIPKIYNIFQRDGILPTMYASTWFISLFARSIDFKIVLRIFDCFFFEGFKVIYRISLALLKLKESSFCKTEKGGCLPLLQTVLENIDEEELFKVAFGFSISRTFIDKIEADYEIVKNNEKNEFISQLFF